MSTEVLKQSMKRIPIGSVVVGKRFRKELGNMFLLTESIKAIGLLQPVVVRKDMTLVCGGRRLEACKRLEHEHINVVVADSFEDELTLLAAERDENTCREEMAVSELVALATAIEKHEREAAKERQASGLKQNRSEDSAERIDRGDTRDKVAAAVGMSHDTLAKAREVVEAAKDRSLPAEVRETAKAAVEEMDRTGKVAGAHRMVAEAKGDTKPPTLHTNWDKLTSMNERARSFFEGIVADRRENEKSNKVLSLYEDLESAIESYRKSIQRNGV